MVETFQHFVHFVPSRETLLFLRFSSAQGILKERCKWRRSITKALKVQWPSVVYVEKTIKVIEFLIILKLFFQINNWKNITLISILILLNSMTMHIFFFYNLQLFSSNCLLGPDKNLRFTINFILRCRNFTSQWGSLNNNIQLYCDFKYKWSH